MPLDEEHPTEHPGPRNASARGQAESSCQRNLVSDQAWQLLEFWQAEFVRVHKRSDFDPFRPASTVRRPFLRRCRGLERNQVFEQSKADKTVATAKQSKAPEQWTEQFAGRLLLASA